jgi:hypothetical protein
VATVADAWRPTSELEHRLQETVRAGDQESYFRLLADSELVVPVPPELVDGVLANETQPSWPTQEEDGRVHVLAYTSASAMRACLGPSYQHFMTVRFGDIAETWPDARWWLAIDAPAHGVGAVLPIEARMPAWFVRQVAEGDGRPPQVGRAPAAWEELRDQHRELPRQSPRPEFQPANDVERELLRAAANNDHDLFLQTLADTDVLLPVPNDMDFTLRPGRPGFPWQTREVDGSTVVPVFTSPERLLEASGAGTEYIKLPFTVALRYWPNHDWLLAINSGSPAGGTVLAQQLPGLATWADQRAAQRMTDQFEPQNDIEQRLFDVARRRDTDAFYKTLLGAQVLVPAETDTPWGIVPGDPDFPWRPVPIHGRTSIQVFTSLKWMNEAIGSSRFIMPSLHEMVAAWPDTDWTLVLNPGTPIDAAMPGDQLRTLRGPATPPSASTPPPPEAPAVPVAPPVPPTPTGPAGADAPGSRESTTDTSNLSGSPALGAPPEGTTDIPVADAGPHPGSMDGPGTPNTEPSGTPRVTDQPAAHAGEATHTAPGTSDMPATPGEASDLNGRDAAQPGAHTSAASTRPEQHTAPPREGTATNASAPNLPGTPSETAGLSGHDAGQPGAHNTSAAGVQPGLHADPLQEGAAGSTGTPNTPVAPSTSDMPDTPGEAGGLGGHNAGQPGAHTLTGGAQPEQHTGPPHEGAAGSAGTPNTPAIPSTSGTPGTPGETGGLSGHNAGQPVPHTSAPGPQPEQHTSPLQEGAAGSAGTPNTPAAPSTSDIPGTPGETGGQSGHDAGQPGAHTLAGGAQPGQHVNPLHESVAGSASASGLTGEGTGGASGMSGTPGEARGLGGRDAGVGGHASAGGAQGGQHGGSAHGSDIGGAGAHGGTQSGQHGGPPQEGVAGASGMAGGPAGLGPAGTSHAGQEPVSRIGEGAHGAAGGEGGRHAGSPRGGLAGGEADVSDAFRAGGIGRHTGLPHEAPAASPGETSYDGARAAGRDSGYEGGVADAAPSGAAGVDASGEGRRADVLRAVEPVFEPGNRIDQELYDAAFGGDSDAFLRVLLNANVLVPIPGDAPLEVTPMQREFRWGAALRSEAAVQVFTSLVRLREVLPESRFVYADFRELIGAWPRDDWAMLLNPGTRIGASLQGDQVRALSEWAVRVGLVPARPEVPLPPPRPEPAVAPLPADPDDRVSSPMIMQKVVPHNLVPWYLEQGYDRVGGFVHSTGDVAELQTPGQLYEALGLLYDGSPFSLADDGVYVIRWPAYCPDLYRVPFGGRDEAELAAWGEAGWVIERAPFVGGGFAPGSAGSIREYKVDSVRLPYGAEMYYLGHDRSERFVAMYDPDRLAWLRPEPSPGPEGWDGRTEAAQ